MAIPGRTAHSSVVRMMLNVNGATLPIAQMGPDFIILKAAAESKARHGIVTISVDGVIETVSVYLPAGISASSKRIIVAEVGAKERVLA